MFRLQPQRQERADGHGRARAAADHDRLQVVIAMRELRIDAIDRLEHGRERGLLFESLATHLVAAFSVSASAMSR